MQFRMMRRARLLRLTFAPALKRNCVADDFRSRGMIPLPNGTVIQLNADVVRVDIPVLFGFTPNRNGMSKDEPALHHHIQVRCDDAVQAHP